MSPVEEDRSPNVLVRAAAVIGDLSNPFFAEERQRDVWNEASAVALQVFLWLSLLAATGAAWLVGADAVPYVYVLLGIIGVAGWVAILYSASKGVSVDDRAWRSRPRMVAVAVLAVALAAGVVRAAVADVEFDGWSTVAGMVVGAGTALVVAAVVVRSARRWGRAGEENPAAD